MRRILPALLLPLLASPVQAAAPAEGAPGTNIEMPYRLIAPMNGADGKLASYAYIAVRLTAHSDTGANDVRDKIAFIQDAFVRDVNAAAIVRADDITQVDTQALQVRLLADARKIVAGGKIDSLAILQVQIAPLHPQQSPSAPPEDDQAPAGGAKAP